MITANATAATSADDGPTGPTGALSRAWNDGAEAAQDDDVSLRDRVGFHLMDRATLANLDPTVAMNLAAGAVMLLITLMIVLLAALVGGRFADAIPSDSVFSEAITTTTDNAGTAFVIFGVSLLAIPTVSVLAYIVMKLGPFIGFNGMGGGNLMNRR